MTLVERLRNPAWESDGSIARLNVERTLEDMRQAADVILALEEAVSAANWYG